MSDITQLEYLIESFNSYAKELCTLLEEDACYFKENSLSLLEASNAKKTELNLRLDQILTEFNRVPLLSSFKGSLHEKLLLCTVNLPLDERQTLMISLSEMQELTERYTQLMAINRQVVNANLSYIKDVFYAIVNDKTQVHEQPGTYGRTGVLETAL